MINSIIKYSTRNNEGPKRFGAVVVDMQPGFLENISESDKEKLFISQTETLENCVRNNYPIVALEFSDYGKTDNRIRKIITKSQEYVFITKSKKDGFEKIKKQLSEWDVNNLCFMGISAAYCVQATASSAVSSGKRILTARELIASQTYRQEEFDACIPWFQKNGTYFSNYEKLIHEINIKDRE